MTTFFQLDGTNPISARALADIIRHISISYTLNLSNYADSIELMTRFLKRASDESRISSDIVRSFDNSPPRARN